MLSDFSINDFPMDEKICAVHLKCTTDLSLLAIQDNIFRFDSIIYDNEKQFTKKTFTYTIPKRGHYSVYLNLSFKTTAIGLRWGYVSVNDNNNPSGMLANSDGNLAVINYFERGDKIQIKGGISSGTSILLADSEFAMWRISN